MVTVTPGSTLSELSTTFPLIDPVVAPTVCAAAASGRRRSVARTQHAYLMAASTGRKNKQTQTGVAAIMDLAL
jgi:hypothetical protein